jgi:protocatechuate 3,4-dioxygenase beta subunit
VTDRILASLVYDTKAQPLSSGIRAVVQRARRMLYAAGETELVLQIAPDKQPERMKLAGQVLDEGMPVEGAAVNLQGPSSRVDQSTDEEGEFLIGALPPGTYSLEIETPARAMAVPPLDVE